LLERQGRFLRRAFSSYVAPALVDKLVDDPRQLKLGGERREMSFLFTDLAGFTGLVERQEPEDTVSLLNLYLDQMIEIAKRHGGTIDKIIGDAVVVLFSAPLDQSDHAQRAVECALEMDKFATQFAAEQTKKGIPVGTTRIGVNSGVAMIGNLGGSGFFDYTALGDAMNTAARLESVNKYLGTRIAVSGETARQCTNFTGRMAARLILKGKQQITDAFEPVSDALVHSELFDRYASAYELMASKDRNARKAFEQLATDFPDDPLTQLHLGRLKAGEKGDLIQLAEK
jgi:adenylate cyclase